MSQHIIAEPRIETMAKKKFIGIRINMSFSNNKTEALWRSFMPKRGKIKNSIGSELYSIEVYPPLFFNNFNPDVEFEKWAALEVVDLEIIPNGMESMVSPKGLYAVFVHRGPASSPKTYQYIFATWLPSSLYLLDNRPHFAIMGEKYKHEHPESEEELWIPIKLN